jgi:formylmethanofuran--tetrahydromethanopterin N-formyltransferase
MRIKGTEIEDTFAEAFPMWAARAVVTAASYYWAEIAAREATGYGTSVIGCDAEAGLETYLSAQETPDRRPGVSCLFFAFSRDRLEQALSNRVGQCVMTCPTTACYDGLPQAERTLRVGALLRYFGDGYQISKLLELPFGVQQEVPAPRRRRRVWRVPVMDGEFLCDDVFGAQKGVGGGNFLILGETPEAALAAAVRAVDAIARLRDVITPFPGGVVRSGSKVGSKYKKLRASTNDPYCPTLRAVVPTALPAGVEAVYEIVIDGLTEAAVAEAMRVGIEAACGRGVVRISAGNYGGKLGPYHFYLHRLWTRASS